MGPVQELFLRFRDQGDAASLGSLYDVAAPELLAGAMRLCRDRSEAEDVLQSTFVTAMESASRFDDTRAILPWLYGILVVHAREARRHSAKSPDPERLIERVVADPAREVEDLEFRFEVEELVRELPANYRGIVRSFLDGREPSKFASEFNLSQGAARVRLHRGLKLLRKSLSKSWVPAWIAVTPEQREAARGLRDRVLAAARAARPAPGSSPPVPPAGVPAAFVGLAVASLVALVAGTAWFVLRDERASLAASVSTTASEDVGVPAVAATPTLPAARGGGRRPLGGAGGAEASNGALLRRSGRVVDPNGVPLGGAEVFLGRRTRAEVSVWTEVEPARAAADGRFELAHPPVEPSEDATVILFAEAGGGLGWAPLHASPATEFELVVAPPRLLEVRLTDPFGDPLPELEVVAQPRFHPWPDRLRAGEPPAAGGRFARFHGVTDAFGVARFVLPVAYRATPPADTLVGAMGAAEPAERVFDLGTQAPVRSSEGGAVATHYVRVFHPDWVVEPRTVEVAVDGATLVLVAFPRRGAGPRGTVVTRTGATVAGAEVLLLREGEPCRVTSTDAAGHYTFDESGLCSWQGTLEVRAAGLLARRLPFDVEELRAAGGRFDVELAAEGALAGTVLDDTGRGLEGARVSVLGADLRQVAVSMSRADGSFVFDAEVPEDGVLRCQPPAAFAAWVPTRLFSLAELERPPEVRLVLPPEPRATLAVRAVAEGEPVDLAASRAFLLPVFEADNLEYPLISARTEADRLVFERVPAGLWNLWLSQPGRPLVCRMLTVTPEDERTIEFEVGEFAWLHGRVSEPEGCTVFAKCGAGIVLPQVAGSAPMSRELELFPDGSFVLEDAAPGPWLVFVQRGEELEHFVSLELVPGENGPIDLAPQALATLRVRGEGASPAGVVALWVAGEDGAWRIADLARAGDDPVTLQVELAPAFVRWRITHRRDFTVDAPAPQPAVEGTAVLAPGGTHEAIFPVADGETEGGLR